MSLIKHEVIVHYANRAPRRLWVLTDPYASAAQIAHEAHNLFGGTSFTARGQEISEAEASEY